MGQGQRRDDETCDPQSSRERPQTRPSGYGGRGPGISDEGRELIFRRFWRRDRSQQGSTGLGLSIVQRIVELHGATITVENRISGGAQFSIHFLAADKTGCGAVEYANVEIAE